MQSERRILSDLLTKALDFSPRALHRRRKRGHTRRDPLSLQSNQQNRAKRSSVSPTSFRPDDYLQEADLHLRLWLYFVARTTAEKAIGEQYLESVIASVIERLRALKEADPFEHQERLF
jgi:hypothetical protein